MAFSPRRKKVELEKTPPVPMRKMVSDIRPAGAPRVPRRLPAKPVDDSYVRPTPESRPEPKKLPIETLAPNRTAPQDKVLSQMYERQTHKTTHHKRGLVVAALSVVVILLGVMFAIYRISTLTLAVTPTRTPFDLNAGVSMTMPAKDFSVSSAKRGEGESKNEKQYNEKARGTLIVYNNYNSAPQTLIATTRFQTEGGLIFRATKQVIVPGKTGDTPGSAEVEVVADQTGEKYNVGMADFTIPGFAGTSKFDKFYARTKSEIKGGSVGEGKVVGKAEADELLLSLENEVKSELNAEFEKSIPQNVISFPDKKDIVITQRLTDPPVGSPGDRFFGEVRGEIQTMVVEKDAFTAAAGKLLLKDRFKDGAYKVRDDASELVFRNVVFDKEKDMVTFTVEGRLVFESVIDVTELRNKVLEAGKYADLETVYRSYPSIRTVEPTFTPSFFKRIPRDPERVKIEIRS